MGRRAIYLLSKKGIDLAQVWRKWCLWAAAFEEAGNQPLVQLMRKKKDQVIATARLSWIHSRGLLSRAPRPRRN